MYENTEIVKDVENNQSNLPKFIQATDIKTPLIEIENAGHVTESDWLRYPMGRVKRGELLIEVKGNVEKIALVPENLPEKTLISGTLYKCETNNQINKYFLAMYLSCKHGQRLKKRLISNIATPFINKQDLYSIPIPDCKSLIQNKIESVYKLSIGAINKSKKLYQQGQNYLLSELNLKNRRPQHRLSFVKDYSDTQKAGRIDADYYQPKYDEVINAIINHSGGWDVLDNLVTMRKCIEVGSEEYAEEGIPFVRVSNLSPFEITEEKYISESLYGAIKEHQPRKGDILFSKDATPGTAYFFNETPSKMIPSGGILRLKRKSDDVNDEYLTLVLNSILTKEQVNRDVGGSVILHWRPDQVKEIAIPILSKAKQNKIKQKVIESFKLREQSKRLLECAKRAVEIAIEKNEKQAMKWLEKEKDKIQKQKDRK